MTGEAPMSHAATIYVVDDDDAVRNALQMLLECEGFSVVAFASSADFLRHPVPERGICILLDVHMPGISGLEVLDRLRRASTLVPVIVMTGVVDAAIARAARRMRAALLPKPFGGDEMLAAIDEALRTVAS